MRYLTTEINKTQCRRCSVSVCLFLCGSCQFGCAVLLLEESTAILVCVDFKDFLLCLFCDEMF